MEVPAIKILNESNGNCCASLESTKTNMSKVLSLTRRYQERVKRHLDDNYVNYQANRTSADLFSEEGETLLREAENLLKNVDSDAMLALREANDDLQVIVEELQEVALGLKVSNRILKIDDLFQCIEEANGTKEYLVALDYLGKLRSLIFNESGDAMADRVFRNSECFDTINVNYHIQANILQQNLQQRFEHLVQFSEKSYPNSKFITIKISKDVSQLQDTCMALFQARYNPTEICNFLLLNCLEPIICKPVSVDLSDSDGYAKLTLSYSSKEVGNSLRPTYKQVFEHINLLFKVLTDLNVSVSPTQHVFTIIGDNIKAKFLKLLLNECLLNAIPETIDEMEESTLVDDVLKFEQVLADTDLINSEKDRQLSKFTEQFEMLFHNRFFKKVLDTAKHIMQKDLQDMIAVSEKVTSEDIEMNPFTFPPCTVSKGTLELVKLLERLVRQPANENEKNGNVYLCVVPKIIDAYVHEVPKYHEKLIESIPQQSALFYNNCMYLSYWLARHTGEVIPETPALGQALQTIGMKYLDVQIENQQKILKGILKDLDFSGAHTLRQGQDKLIKQCLRQLELLKNVWQSVLPDAIYISTFCDLLNDFCIDVIKRILAMEDISTTMANELSELIELILRKAPSIFKDEHDVIKVYSWMKLQQLKMILNASLMEIMDKWCDGAGILTANYKPDEIRHLIRALFQNTDRRAQALAKIC